MSLNTKYLGLDLKNPIIVGSSSLTDSVSKVKECAAAGAGAVVLKSFFEEQVNKELAKMETAEINLEHTEAFDYISNLAKDNEINQYVELVKGSKSSVNIPIIASINCVTEFEWEVYAIAIEKAGADAIELNIFYNETDSNITSTQIIDRYCNIVKNIKKAVSVPVAVKITDHFTNISRIVAQLIKAGADGIVMFNRFYSPDIDIEQEVLTKTAGISSSSEFSSSLRWIGILADRYEQDFVATTGIHNGESIVKQLLVGSSAVEIASVLYKNGVGIIPELLDSIEEWMNRKNYNSIKDFKGKLSQAKVKEPFSYERFQFIAPISK